MDPPTTNKRVEVEVEVEEKEVGEEDMEEEIMMGCNLHKCGIREGNNTKPLYGLFPLLQWEMQLVIWVNLKDRDPSSN